MKKVLLALSALALVGAGCSAATNVTTDTTVQTPPANTSGSAGTNVDAGAGATVTTPPVNVDVGANAAVKVTMAATNFAFAPKTITAKVGQPVEVTFSTVAGFHNFTIDGVTSASIATGSTVKFNAPSAPGSYPYYCNIGSHRAQGMEGVLIVQ